MRQEYLAVIEGLLFLVGDEGLTLKMVAEVLEVTKKEAALLLDDLMAFYHTRELRGLDIVNYGNTYKMVTVAAYDQYYRKLIEQNVRKLSRSALETLAIVAYYQPITRSRIEEIRGVGCDAMIRKLIAKALIKEAGREESPGRPILYQVTDRFLDAFKLTSLDELPKLKEIESSFDEDDIFNTKYQENVQE